MQSLNKIFVYQKRSIIFQVPRFPYPIITAMNQNRLFKKQHLLLCVVMMLALQCFSQVVPLPHAYAHNDYWHKRPLYDALDNGFTHIEADVYLRHSKLLVAHRPPILGRKSTIEHMYLKPLFDRLANPNETVQTPLDTIVLMIDIKSKGERTYTALSKILNKYKSILSTCDKGKVVIRNLTLVLTGHKPMHMLKSEETRFVFADADLKKMDKSEEVGEMYSTASCKYSSLVKWKGKGEIPEFEKERLTALVNQAHLSGTKVRLWATPEKEVVWNFLRDCGVDLINTDKLQALKQFFIKSGDTGEEGCR